jgi:hypothetical protein
MRTIFAILIAVAVAILPTAKAFAFIAPDIGMTEMSAAEPMHDCCPDETNPCDKKVDGCAFMTACVLKCFSFWTASFSVVENRPTDLAVLPFPVSAALHERVIGPLFRPPRS